LAKIVGDKRLMENLRRLVKESPKIVAAALYQVAVKVQKKSMERTPVQFNSLRSSHETEKPKITSDGIKTRVKVGGPAAPYAVHVHYRPAKHTVGEDRFLEKSLNEAKNTMAKDIAKIAKRKIHAKMKNKGSV